MQPLRRRRKVFAIAEPLESRTLLTAVLAGFSSNSLLALNPPTSALISESSEDASAQSEDVTGTKAATQDLSNESGLADGLLSPQRIVSREMASLANSINGFATQSGVAAQGFDDGFQFQDLIGDADVVELRLAESGRLVSFGATAAVQDEAGITIGDSSGPSVYLRTTTADGQVLSRMAYITRGPRRAATTDVRPVAMREGAVLAEVDFDAVANPAQWSSHADLHDLATGLDFDNADANALDTNSEASRLTDQDQQSSTVTNSQTKVSSASRVAVVIRTFQRRPDTSALSRNAQTTANAAASAETSHDNDGALVVPVAVDPFFEPQFKHLVVVLCLLGTFAKPIVRFSRLPIIRRLRRTVTGETRRPDSVPM